jgi:hypothetical protein
MITKEFIYKEGLKKYGQNFEQAASWLCDKLVNDCDEEEAFELMRDMSYDYRI